MPEPLKNLYNPAFFQQFSKSVKQVVPQFNEKKFCSQLFDENWEQKELKQRMRHVSSVLNSHLPGDYKEQMAISIQIIEKLKQSGVKGSFEYMFFPDFIEQFGLTDVKTSLKAMETVTQFVSCEYAIRPFLLRDQDKVMKQMLSWSKHPHHHVRRFSSEGCRPRLPWGMAIQNLKKDPSPILPILENLKTDESLFVRKSVANNLNDIAKDHPDTVIEVVRKWKGENEKTDWIIRHGCRTLLKKANPSVYTIFGLDGAGRSDVLNFRLNKNKLKIGDRLRLSFELKTGRLASKIRLEYAIYFAKANGKQNRKIFQLTEKNFDARTSYHFKKEQSFRDLTTRKHYPGPHKIAIVVNGKELSVKDFLLVP